MQQKSQNHIQAFTTFTIVGNVASGKSTAFNLCIDAFDAHPIQADTLFQTTNPFAKEYLNDLQRWAFTNELWLTFTRANMIANKLDGEKLTIIDSGFYMSWVYTYGHFANGKITKNEWELYQDLFNYFVSQFFTTGVHGAVFLDYPMPTLFKRLKKRGRDYELTYYSIEYLQQIQDGLNELQNQFRRWGVDFLIIDEQIAIDFVENKSDERKLLSKIDAFLKK